MAVNNNFKVTVGIASTEVVDCSQGNVKTDLVLSADPTAVVWVSRGEPAVVGEGIRLDLYAPKHTFWGTTSVPVYAIAEAGTPSIGVHSG
jgi:hypothetical protein